MLVRVLTRTHYQVDEPAYLRELVISCTSATRSEYPERVAERLQKRTQVAGRALNLSAAKYGVDLAKGLGLLTENNFWSDHAQTLNLLEQERAPSSTLELALSPREQLFFFRLLFEYDGAALIYFAHSLVQEGTIPVTGQSWSAVANAMMESIYSEYLSLTSDIAERMRVRALLAKRASRPYSGKSGPHQCFFHLQALTRIGLLARPSENREYTEPESGRRSLSTLTKIVPDLGALELLIAKGRWVEVVAAVFGLDCAARDPMVGRAEILQRCRDLYVRVRATGASLCPLRTLIETMQVEDLAAGRAPPKGEDVMATLRQAQADHPRGIRFHVDRIGRPTFVVFDAV